MKALSVQQPWAWALFHGKQVENRDKNFSHRGPLLIHASKTFDEEGYEWLVENQEKLGIGCKRDSDGDGNCYLHPQGCPRLPRPEEFKRGGLVGIVNMTDCVREYKSLWFFGPWGHVYKDQGEFESVIPFRGMPGLFDVPQTTVLQALQQLKFCPQCKSGLVYANIGDGTVDTYCEECGFPDENRAVNEEQSS